MALEPPPRALSDIVRDVEPSLVCVKTPTQSGSGFVIDYSGNVITNAHVVEHHKDVILDFVGNVGVSGVVLGVNRDMDLACLRVTGDAELTPVSLGDSDLAQVGEDVFVMGFPLSSVLNASPTVTRGVISAKHSDRLQTDAAINPGNSGGPLIDDSGHVIGVNTSVVEIAEGRIIEGIGFAIPINVVKAELRSLASGIVSSLTNAANDGNANSSEWATYTLQSAPIAFRMPPEPEWQLFNLRENGANFESSDHWYFTLSVVSAPLLYDFSTLEELARDSERELLNHATEVAHMERTILSRGWIPDSVSPTWHLSYIDSFDWTGRTQHAREEVFLLHAASRLTHILTAHLQAPFGLPRDDALMARMMREFLDTVSLM